jgi:hypothetical protein
VVVALVAVVVVLVAVVVVVVVAVAVTVLIVILLLVGTMAIGDDVVVTSVVALTWSERFKHPFSHPKMNGKFITYNAQTIYKKKHEIIIAMIISNTTATDSKRKTATN